MIQFLFRMMGLRRNNIRQLSLERVRMGLFDDALTNDNLGLRYEMILTYAFSSPLNTVLPSFHLLPGFHTSKAPRKRRFIANLPSFLPIRPPLPTLVKDVEMWYQNAAFSTNASHWTWFSA